MVIGLGRFPQTKGISHPLPFSVKKLRYFDKYEIDELTYLRRSPGVAAIHPRVREREMGSDAKVYTLKEVSQHNTNKDCWLVIGGKVFLDLILDP